MKEQGHQRPGVDRSESTFPAETRDLLTLPGIEGVGHDGTHVIVYVQSESVEVPDEVDGWPTRRVVTGEIVAG